MKKLCVALSFAGSLLLPLALHADPLNGNFSVTGTFIANDIAPNPPGNGTPTLTFSDIAAGAGITITGSFADIVAPFETSPSHGSIPYTLGATTTYPNTFVEFVNTTDPNKDLFVQILNLNATRGALQVDGTYSYTYFGDVDFFVGALSGGVFTPNPAYSTTPGTFHFTAQDEVTGAVTFSGTALVPPVSTAPEPGGVALLGTAALAGAGFIKKRLTA